MDSLKFNEVIENRILKIREVLTSKGKEYASNVDRLHNFKMASKITRTNDAQALLGMMVKHLVSIIDMVEEFDDKIFKKKYIDEKMGDAINYLILLEALFIEKLPKR